PHRARGVRGDARYRAQVRQPRQGQSRLGDSLGRDDVPLPRLGGGCGCDHHRHGPRHRTEDRHLRLRPSHGGRAGSVDQRLRRCADPQPLARITAADRATDPSPQNARPDSPVRDSRGAVGPSPMRSPPPRDLLEWARKVQAIAQNGLAFTRDPFDRERYTQLTELVALLLSRALEMPVGAARALWADEHGYATPKVDVRGGVFRGEQVLLVRERADG